MRRLFLIITYLFFANSLLLAQSTEEETTLRKRIIKGIADYRSELVNKSYNNLEQYIKVSLADAGNDYEKTLNIVKNLSIKGLKNQYPNKSLYEEIRKYELGEKSIFRSFSPIEMKTISQNIDLFGLIFQQILKSDFPYGINPKTKFIGEVIFTGIKDGDKVADVGAGTGEISFQNRFFVMEKNVDAQNQCLLLKLNLF